jgi:hypothetical protein
MEHVCCKERAGVANGMETSARDQAGNKDGT